MVSAPIPLPPKLEKDATPAEWKRWRQTFEDYATIVKLKDESAAYRQTIFRTAIGLHALDVHNVLPFETAEDQKDRKKTLDLMSEHYVGKVNTIFERFKFHQRAQREQECNKDYITALRTLAETCDLKNAKPDNII